MAKVVEKPAAAVAKKRPLTKTQMIVEISQKTGVPKKDVSAVLDSMSTLVRDSLGNKGVGSFIFPGLVKIYKKRYEATPAKKHVPKPFKPGEFYDKPAQKAHSKVKVTILKALKDL